MFAIRFESQSVVPDDVVVIRTAAGNWTDDRGGVYAGGAWTFNLNEHEFAAGLEFKFLIRPERWMRGTNIIEPAPADGQILTYRSPQVEFPFVADIPGDGTVARTLLKPVRPSPAHYDVIVVGSGMGGGILASALADAQVSVLLLEAGPLLFPTHVGNLPRRHWTGQFSKHVWSLWKDFGVVNVSAVGDTKFNGAAAFNLGGRSVFWGGLTPKLAGWELGAWPAEVRDYLLDGDGYARAEETFNVAPPPMSDFQESSRAFLQGIMPGWDVVDVPMAIQYRGATEWSIPAGYFSTADLLLEDVMIRPEALIPGDDRALTIKLRSPVHTLRFDAGNTRVTEVACYDIVEGMSRTYQADKAVVLCAGTIESARIALRSAAADPSGKIGRGITDHLIRYKHFVVPPGHAHASPTDSAKFLLQHPAATRDEHAFDIVIELGNPFNQGRYVHPGHLDAEIDSHPGSMVCEIVFQYYSPLLDTNSVTVDGDIGPGVSPAQLTMAPSRPSDALLTEADQITAAVLQAFDARPFPQEEGVWPALETADLGGVSHEVGTLRMADDGTGVVDEDLKFLRYENLYACDNSVFPVSPAANPSLTLAALAHRLADRLAKL